MIFFDNNLRIIRKKLGLSQGDLAEKLKIKPNSISNYENGISTPDYQTLFNLIKILDISTDALLYTDLSKVDKIPSNTGIVNETSTEYVSGKNIRILPIHVTEKNKENIVLVPIKAIAGYVSGGFQDKEFVGKLPSFNLVGYTGSTFRAFEIKGESMHPTYHEKDLVICKYVEDWINVKEDRSYIIHTNEGLVCKRIINDFEKHKQLILTSDNSDFKPYAVLANEIREVWEIQSYIRIAPIKKKHFDADDLLSSIRNLESAIKSIKKG